MGGGGRLQTSYRLYCSKTDMATDMPMVCKLKFVHYGHTKKHLAPYVPQFHSDLPLKVRSVPFSKKKTPGILKT